MKRRILNLGIPATHDLITNLDGLENPISISDFDAFVLDPEAVARTGVTAQNFFRRGSEIQDLLSGKGGVIVCLLRQPLPLGFQYAVQGFGNQAADALHLFDKAAVRASAFIRSALRAGSGTRVEVIPNARGPSAQYLRVLERALRFVACLETNPDILPGVGGTVFAVDSVQHPISVEFAVGAGRICFVPVPEGVGGDRVGAAIVRTVEAHYGGIGEIEVPPWLADIAVPGATAHDPAISKLEERKEQIEAEITGLKQKRADLFNYRVLLYGYGKTLLEPVVRSAFRLLNFEVPESDQYKGEWDVELHEPRTSATSIGEVEGSEGIIDVDKYRQLLDYFQTEVLEGRDCKGILIGNGYRMTSPDSADRNNQFSDHAIRGAKKNGFCLLPTTELFKAVCAVLEAPEDEGLKIRIRDSILSTVGVWTFAREIGMPQGAQPEDGARERS